VRNLRRALAEGGKAAVVGFTSLAKLISVSLRGGRNITQVSAHVATTDLEFLANLIEAGKVRPHIDRRYPFAEIPAAIAYLEQGHARGKVVGARREDLPSLRPLTRYAASSRRLRLVDINIPLPRVGALCHAPGDDSTEEDDSNKGEVQQATLLRAPDCVRPGSAREIAEEVLHLVGWLDPA
jgi:hypothetical protein